MSKSDPKPDDQMLDRIRDILGEVKEYTFKAEDLIIEREEKPGLNSEQRTRVKSLQGKVRAQTKSVESTINEAHQQLNKTWNFALDVDLANLEYQWGILQHKLHALRKHQRNHSVEVDFLHTRSETRSLSPGYQRFLSPVSPRSESQSLSSSYQRLLSPVSPRFPVDLSSSQYLKSKGRKCVTKLSGKYRAVIKSRVKFKPRSRSFLPANRSLAEFSTSTSSFITAPSTADSVSVISDECSPDSTNINTVGKISSLQRKYGNLKQHQILSPADKANFTMEGISVERLKSHDSLGSIPTHSDLTSIDSQDGQNSSAQTPGRKSPSGRKSPRGRRSPVSTPDGRWSPSSEGRRSPTIRPLNLDPKDSPIDFKRRKIDFASFSPMSSTTQSPVMTPEAIRRSISKESPERILTPDSTRSIDDWSDCSYLNSPQESPLLKARHAEMKGKYRKAKDELWAAIKSDYQYIMDEEIIEACKSTESDLSGDGDDLGANPNVSFAEFMQQYKELTDWLNQIQVHTQSTGSLSEKYLNQSYREELLQRSPRRKLFNHYAKQLVRRYPNMKEEINIRLQHLNDQWSQVERAFSPIQGMGDQENMLRDLEQDLNTLRQWLHEVESQLLPLCLNPSWTPEDIEKKLRDHQDLQRDIESHSRVVSAVLKLCERLQGDQKACTNDEEKESLQLVALNLERRWHAIWLQSLEWQCRLEEAVKRRKGLVSSASRRSSDNWSSFSFKTAGSAFDTHIHDVEDGYKRDLNDTGEYLLDDDEDDLSNSDVIPFSENEYEKITSDTDNQPDEQDQLIATLKPGGVDQSGKLTREEVFGKLVASRKQSAAKNVPVEDMEGFDSGIAKSLDGSPVSHDGFVVKEDAGDEGRVVGGDDGDDKLKEMVLKAMFGKPGHLESHDVGYSSEGQSNEEIEYGIKEGGTEMQTSVTQGVNISNTSVVIRKKVTMVTTDETGTVQTAVTSVPATESWRHSITSAYDTSSNCSEHETTGGTTDGEGEKHGKYQDIVSSSTEKFYHMTPVESDLSAETSDGTRKQSITHDVVQNGVSNSESETETKSTTRTRLDFMVQDLEHRLDSSKSYLESDDFISADKKLGPAPEVSVDTFSNYNQTYEMYKSTSDQSSDNNSESMAVQVDSDPNRDLGLSQEEVDALVSEEENNEKNILSGDRESVDRLIRQAESLIRDEDFLKMQHTKWVETTKTSKRRKRKRAGPSDSSAREDPRSSSCDASSEYTSGSVSDQDYSTASSEEENVYSSVIFTGKTQGENDSGQVESEYTGTSRSTSASPKRDLPPSIKLRQKSHRKRASDRPRSVTELYELTNRLDLSPFSISEGAIDSLHNTTQSGNLQVTSSDSRTFRESSPGSKSPRHKRIIKAKYKLKRCSSESERVDVKVTTAHAVEGTVSETAADDHDEKLREMVLAAMNVNEGKEDESVNNTMTTVTKETTVTSVHKVDVVDAAGHDSDRDSDDTDELLASTIESVSASEAAWDDYQLDTFRGASHYKAPPYSTVTSDEPEEKLDDSKLWEHGDGFEFDEELIPDSGMYSAEFSAKNVSQESKRVSGGASSQGYHGDVSRVEDSDSDLEDFQHVIQSTKKQIKVAENSLRLKPRKDDMNTGLYMDFSEYTELIATCQTNIKCLQVIIEHLNEDETSLTMLTEEDIQEVHDIIAEWEKLQTLAVERQLQSRQLCAMYKEMQSLNTFFSEIEVEMAKTEFENVAEMERCIQYLQESRLNISEQQNNLAALGEKIANFADTYTEIKMSTFKQEALKLCTKCKAAQKSAAHVASIQSVIISWYDYNETSKELTYLLQQQRQQLQLLKLGQEVLLITDQDVADAVYDLKNMLTELESIDGKMVALRQLSEQIIPYCSAETKTEIRASVGLLSNELEGLKYECNAAVAKIQEKRDTDVEMTTGPSDEVDDIMITDENEENIDAEAATVTKALETVGIEAEEIAAVTSAVKQKESIGGIAVDTTWEKRRSFYRRILRAAIPLQILIVLLFGLAILMQPDCCEYFNNLTLSLSPQLRYIRGPPPT